MLRSLASLAVILVILLSGCAGGAGPTAATSTSPTVLPTHSAETGAIEGVVTDGELLPIAGARVGLVKENLQTTTAANGSYAFADVAPGTHQIFYEALGFQAVGKRVEVVAGSVSRSDVSLAAIAVGGEASLVAIPKTILLNLDGPWSIDTTEGPYVNVSQYQDLRCSPCYALLHYAPGEAGVHTDLKWSGTYVSPVSNTVILRYVRNWTAETGPSTSTGKLVHRPILGNGEGTTWGEGAVREARSSGGLMKFFATIPRDSLAVGMKVETWTTFAYNGAIPEDYSAFPPE